MRTHASWHTLLPMGYYVNLTSGAGVHWRAADSYFQSPDFLSFCPSPTFTPSCSYDLTPLPSLPLMGCRLSSPPRLHGPPCSLHVHFDCETAFECTTLRYDRLLVWYAVCPNPPLECPQLGGCPPFGVFSLHLHLHVVEAKQSQF